MNVSQLKYVWGEIGRIAPLMHLTTEEYKFQLGVEVLKNANGSISKCSMAGFMALKYRLLEDGRKVSSVGTQTTAQIKSPLTSEIKSPLTPEGGSAAACLRKQVPTSGVRGLQADTMRKKLISMAYIMQWASAGDWRKAIEKIDGFVQSDKSIFKKPLMKHNSAELVQVVTQFEQMLKRHYKQVRG